MQLFEVGRTYILDELINDIVEEQRNARLRGNNVLYCCWQASWKSEVSSHKALLRDAAAFCVGLRADLFS
jgi:hypothetical protein